jgi:hypothetical protein
MTMLIGVLLPALQLVRLLALCSVPVFSMFFRIAHLQSPLRVFSSSPQFVFSCHLTPVFALS